MVAIMKPFVCSHRVPTLSLFSCLLAVIFNLSLIGRIESSKLVPLTVTGSEPYVPYGIYVFRSKWGCDKKEPRCNYELSVDGDVNDLENQPFLTLKPSGNGALWEIIPVEGGAYQIKLKQGCDDTPPALLCDSMLSHQNGIVQLDKDYPTFWKIRLNRMKQTWEVRSDSIGERRNEVMSFTQKGLRMRIELIPQDTMTWELLVDMDLIESQKLDGVKFDFGGEQFYSNETTTLLTDEVHNMADKEVNTKVGLQYQITEARRFINWKGFVMPIDTSMELNSPIFTGYSFEVTKNALMYKTKWGDEIRTSSDATMQQNVPLPPFSYKMIFINAKTARYSIPFTGNLTQAFKTGKMSHQIIRGIYFTTQVFEIKAQVGDAMPLSKNISEQSSVSTNENPEFKSSETDLEELDSNNTTTVNETNTNEALDVLEDHETTYNATNDVNLSSEAIQAGSIEINKEEIARNGTEYNTNLKNRDTAENYLGKVANETSVEAEFERAIEGVIKSEKEPIKGKELNGVKDAIYDKDAIYPPHWWGVKNGNAEDAN